MKAKEAPHRGTWTTQNPASVPNRTTSETRSETDTELHSETTPTPPRATDSTRIPQAQKEQVEKAMDHRRGGRPAPDHYFRIGRRQYVHGSESHRRTDGDTGTGAR